ncbi:unnamed protein product [Discula destructiva]
MAFSSPSQIEHVPAASEPFASETPSPAWDDGTSSPPAFHADPSKQRAPLSVVSDDTLPALNMVIRQDPFSMTLDASALVVVSVLLLMSMHFIPRPLLESCILAVPVFLLIHNDYRNFLALGPGGTPPTVAGYARLAWFRLFALRDPFCPLSPQAHAAIARPSHGILPSQHLPYRPGPAPTVAGLAPQRQLNQHGSVAALTRLTATLSQLAARHPARFGAATSCLEKHGFALFARHPVNVCGNGEICHVHNSDRSMHMTLHPDDIAEILTKGWGQRHPLAWGQSRLSWWFLPALRIRSPVPETFVLIYSPRDESELHVVCKIIEAAIWYTAEERVDLAPLMTMH